MADKQTVGVDLGLTNAEKKTLLQLARTTIEAHVNGRQCPEFTPDTETLNENRGAFVSLHRQGMLRGCIGHLQAVKPLFQTIRDMAVSAAFQDPRFGPLQENELEDLDIEISVLTPMEPVTDINDIEIGTHGLMLVREPFSGLLLPQVATQYGWDREMFLRQTCVKAGLPEEAWQDKETKLFKFSADVF
ncbi:MAG: AmmeMemoRadiSam system protein A [Deltaproteobacteria bacterium]|nr:AmmeMemoRadiSam system protein A [Deltaproteobacteria bacterium]